MSADHLILADADDYPLLDVFWTMLLLFLWILWFFLVFRIISDIFRSRDLGGWGKAAWSLLVIVFPLFGVLAYLILRGSEMHDRELRQAEAIDEAFRRYLHNAAGATSTADELSKLSALRDNGVLTEAEFAAQKRKILS